MAPPNKPKRLWFDIEDTGMGGLTKGHHFQKSSILQLSFTSQEQGPIQDLAARPAEKGMSTWSHQKVWTPLAEKAAKKQIVLESEKAILSKFIKQLEMNTGAELIGWNIGYTPEVVGSQQALRGFDIAGLMTRSAKYGLDKEMKAALQGVKIRDVGQEFGVRIVRGMFENLGEDHLEEMVKKGVLDEEIYKQALGFKKQLGIISGLYGKDTIADQARFVSQAGIRFSGWSQGVAREMMVNLYDSQHGKGSLLDKLYDDINKGVSADDPKFKSMDTLRGALMKGTSAHQADIDVAIARLITDPIESLKDPRTEKEWEAIVKEWGALAEMNKAVGRVRHSNFAGAKLQEVKTSPWFQKLTIAAAGKDPIAANAAEKELGNFWKSLAEEAGSKYGDLPKGQSSWEDAIKGLSPNEKLTTKFGLKSEKTMSQLGPKGLLSRMADTVSSRTTLAAIAKTTIENIAEESKRVLGKGGGIATAALATAAALGPLGILDAGDDEYKQQLSNHWQHTLLGADLEMNKIPSRDDLYNTIRGLPHTGLAHFNRPITADFGSGWIPANGNSLILSDPGFNLEGNFEAMRRAQEAMADEKVNSEEYNSFIRAVRFEKDSSLADHLANDYSYAGRAMGYLAEATRNNPLESDEYFGIKIDPTVMDFRRNVLENSDKRAAFEEELASRQREKLEDLGRFKRSELHDVNLDEFKETALEARNMREINLENFEVEVEDADTLLLHRKGLFSMFDNPISVRLSGIDAPETASHEGDPIGEMDARINQAQPYGEEATAELKRMIAESDNLQLLVSSEPQTYGRYTGVVFGEQGGADYDDINSWGDFGKSEQVNFNMELIRRGAVASLPFGSQQTDMISRQKAAKAEEEAADHDLGMWQYTRYKASRHMSELLKNSITFNTFTQRQKLADNLDLASYASYLQSMGNTRRDLQRADKDLLKNLGGTLRRHGFSGRKRPDYMKGYRKSGRTFGSFSPPPAADYGYQQTFQRKIPLNRPYPKADDDFHNTIEAFRHEGQAYVGRRNTDFGSGWDGDKSEAKLHPFEQSPNVKDTFTKQASTQQSPPTKSSSKDNIVRALAVKDISVYNTNNRKGVATTLTELTAQVQGEKIKSGDLALETKRFSWDSDPSRGSRKQSTPTKVDNTKNTNNIKDNNYLSEPRQLDSMVSKNKRSIRFRNAHHHAIRSVESNNRYPGRRSKRNTGSTILS